MTATVVVVGNRMLGIAALAVAVIAVSPVAERVGAARYGIAVAAALTAGRFLLRRVELAPGEVRWRLAWRLHRTSAAALVDVEVDHRFLRFRAPGHRPVRFEVPAELRPEVRAWAESAGGTG